MSGARWWWRWLPLTFGLVAAASLLLAADTPAEAIGRYAGYAVLGVALPGTLVFRALRRAPHTLVEDIAFGIATGLVLELGAWALLSFLGLQAFAWTWPLTVIALFAVVPRLRRHWATPDYPARPSLAWSWALAGTVIFFLCYVYAVFLALNPVVPDTETTQQFLDLPYQLSLAAEAKHHIPLNVPQVAGEPLHYHWFSFVHLAMTSMVGQLDLPLVTMRFMVPAICSLTAVLTAVVGWRLSGKPWVGAAAAAMFFVIGDFDFAAATWPPFGTQAAFVIWPSLSMTYSWALLVALLGVVGDLLRGEGDGPPRFGRGGFVLLGLLAVASSAAKASSLPVLGGGVALAFLAKAIAARRIPWRIAGIGLIIVAAQLFATAVVFDFQKYGVAITPLGNLSWAWQQPPTGPRAALSQIAVVIATWVAYLLHLQLRAAGILALFWLRRGRLETVQWFLLGGAIAGPALHLTFSGYAASWFGRAGFPFSVLLSAWGYALLLERARLSAREKALLAGAAALFALGLTAVTWRYAVSAYPAGTTYGPIVPMLTFAGVLAAGGLVFMLIWLAARRKVGGLRGRGVLVALTALLVAGAPGLLMDVKVSWGVPGGPYGAKAIIPASYAQAARWVRDHSEPEDIVATNSHCSRLERECASADSFWLSAYSERSILIEGWDFAPRVQVSGSKRFWDSELLQLNEDAFYAPTAAGLQRLRVTHRVRYLVVARDVAAESAVLETLASKVYDTGRVAVYELRAG